MILLTLEKAKKAIEATENKAKELGITVSTFIVDNNGILVAASRMDNSLSVSPIFAEAKAYTAGTLGLPTAEISKYAGPEKPYYGVNALNNGKFSTIAGGLPIVINKKLVGGIGVGGSYDVSEDVKCAEAGLEALKI